MYCWPGCEEYGHVTQPELFVLNEDMGIKNTDGKDISPEVFVGRFPKGCWVVADVMLVM